MIQLAIVGNQQQPGRVFIETANRLHVAFTKRYRQQLKNTGVMLRLTRALVARRFVEHQRGKFGVGPIDAIDCENQPVSVEFDEGIVANLTVDRDTLAADKASAFPSGTETIFLEDTF